MEGQIGNKDVATAASMKRLLPHEHKPLGQNPAVELEASELTRVGEESVRDVILPRGAMPDEKRGVRRIIVFSGDLGRKDRAFSIFMVMSSGKTTDTTLSFLSCR